MQLWLAESSFKSASLTIETFGFVFFPSNQPKAKFYGGNVGKVKA